MADKDDLDGIREHLTEPAKPNKGWPRLPAHGADLATIRDYLTQAAQLPIGYRVHAATRQGHYGSDPMTITINTPGDAQNIEIRVRNQREIQKPAGLRGAFAEATSGATRMKHPTVAQASDYYTMLMALADVGSTAVIADETRQWLDRYLIEADAVHASEHRLDTLIELQRRPAFERPQAQNYIRGELPPGARWALLIDDRTETQWIRVGEFATYIRFVEGIGAMAHHTLAALIAEIGGLRQYWEENHIRKGGPHIRLIMFRVPSEQAIPSLYARSR